MIFAIRDDDISYFTNWQDLEYLYSDLWGKVPISFAVIPFAVPYWRGEVNMTKKSQNSSFKALHENIDLLEYLKIKVQNKEVEIILHGFSHEYRIIKGHRIGEYLWKPKDQLIKETLKAKQYLEEIFQCPIKVFVPPSNMIGKEGIIAIESAGLNLSGIIGRKIDRPISFSYLKAYLRRWIYRFLRGNPYPFPLIIGNHVELVAYSLTPSASLSWLRETMRVCYKMGAPFVLATHHWELIKYPDLYSAFYQLIEEAKTIGYSFGTVSQCMNLIRRR
jgi:peptidoglycan/xylan/chitin deacetylase (PgdA/CDA1 family)